MARTATKRVKRTYIPLPFAGRLVVSVRKFRTKPARRSKSHRQIVFAVYFLPFKEIAISKEKSKKHNTKSNFLSGIPKTLPLKARLPILLFVLGIIGAIYFGLNISRSAKLDPISTSNVPTQVISRSAKPEGAKTMARSEPTRVRISKLLIDAPTTSLGRKQDGSMQVPAQPEVVGWYSLAPTPGELGPAIIAGHVDSPKGPAVFWRLRELQPGDLVEIDRADGTTAKFAVNSIKQFEQNNFPTQEVYGNIDHSGIRLITCGGVFDRQTRRYSHNTVVFGTLVI